MRAAIYLDTCALYNYQRPTVIPWLKLVKADEVLLVFTPSVLRELQKHKDGARGTFKGRQAEALLPLLNQYRKAAKLAGTESAPLDPKTPAVRVFLDPVDPLVKPPLNPDIGDDQLLASILSRREEHPEDAIYLVTDDAGLALVSKADRYGVDVLELPDTYKTEPEKDEKSEENRKLKRELTELRDARPKLALDFEQGGNRLELARPRPFSEDDVQRVLALLYDRYPKKRVNRNEQTFPYPGSELLARYQMFGDSGLLPSQIAEYNDALTKYYKDFESHVRKPSTMAAINAAARYLSFRCVLKNGGTAVARDTHVLLNFPEGVEVRLSAPRVPKPPAAPQFPRSFLDPIVAFPLPVLRNPVVAQLAALEAQREQQRAPRIETLPAKESTADGDPKRSDRAPAQRVTFHVKDLKHTFSHFLDPLFVVFRPDGPGKAIGISYEIVCDSLTKPIAGNLVLDVKDTGEFVDMANAIVGINPESADPEVFS